jgi:hypothetical protein
VYFAPFCPVFQVGEVWIASADSHRPSRHRGVLANNRRPDFKIDKIVMPGPKDHIGICSELHEKYFSSAG